MKTIIAILFFFAQFAYANCSDSVNTGESTEKMEIKTDVPAFLKGATVCVKLATGKESCVPAEKFKVVARAQQFIVTKVATATTRTCTNTVPAAEKNRISLLAGETPLNGMTIDRDGNTQSVQSKYGLTGGVQYQRKTGYTVFGMPLSGGVQVQTSPGALGVLGLDF